MKRVLEGSQAVAQAVARCRPGLICAYPITPQTHIVEELAKMVANGELDAEFLNVESEHSAASAVLGALAAGTRAYTSSSSQGLLLMFEVLFNISGLRLPAVMTVANRAISAPINIWNDQQDSLSVRDTGWIQWYAENNQVAADLHILAYRLAESKSISLPVMICMDGYYLTHSYEPVEIPEQEEVDEFLPPYQPERKLDPAHPLTFGTLVEPTYYAETRFMLDDAMGSVRGVLSRISEEFERKFRRRLPLPLDTFHTEDAQTIVVAMGSICGNLRVAVERMRDKGYPVGLVALTQFRPFPAYEVRNCLKRARTVLVLERGFSPGGVGPLTAEVRSALYSAMDHPYVYERIVGLGGRDSPPEFLMEVIKEGMGLEIERRFRGVHWEWIEDE
ncbi:MAG: pyruvate ferredoxin oxidoreductase [bacterium JZ-2024 1]